MPASQPLSGPPPSPCAPAAAVAAEARLAAQLHRAAGHGEGLAVVLVELENVDGLAASAGAGAVERVLACLATTVDRLLDTAGECLWSGHGELLVLQPLRQGLAQARDLAEDLAQVVNGPFPVGSRAVLVRARIGVAIHPEDGGEPSALLRNARLATRQAARDPRRRPQFFVGEMAERLAEEQRLAEDLRAALDRGGLRLAFQPQLDLVAGRIFAAEALLRWHHPERGRIPPGRFVPIAERSGLIQPLGRWVLREACRIGAGWHTRGLSLGVAVNLSPEQLAYPEIVDEVEEALALAGLPGGRLAVEVTESLLLRDLDMAGRSLERLRHKGVRIALDDFGSGHCGIGYLRALPLDQLKIDRGLVAEAGCCPETPTLTRAVVGMGRSLGLQVLAEGVESAAQLRCLRRLGCDAAQGYLIGRPMPAAALAECVQPPPGRLSAAAARTA